MLTGCPGAHIYATGNGGSGGGHASRGQTAGDHRHPISNVYDIVVVECGPANSAGVKKLLNSHEVEMIFSVVQPEEHLITEYLTDFYAEGFDHLLMMSPGAGTPNRPDRSAA